MLYGFGEYKNTKGRELLIEMVKNKDEVVMSLYGILQDYYPYLLKKRILTNAEINQYNMLVDSNVYELRVRKAIRES